MSLAFRYKSIDAAVNAITDYLQSVFIKSLEVDTLSVSTVSVWDPDATSSVWSHLEKLSKRKPSPDVPNILYKCAAHVLALPLSKRMQLCI